MPRTGAKQSPKGSRQPVLGYLGVVPHGSCQGRRMRTVQPTTLYCRAWLQMHASNARSPLSGRPMALSGGNVRRRHRKNEGIIPETSQNHFPVGSGLGVKRGASRTPP